MLFRSLRRGTGAAARIVPGTLCGARVRLAPDVALSALDECAALTSVAPISLAVERPATSALEVVPLALSDDAATPGTHVPNAAFSWISRGPSPSPSPSPDVAAARWGAVVAAVRSGVTTRLVDAPDGGVRLRVTWSEITGTERAQIGDERVPFDDVSPLVTERHVHAPLEVGERDIPLGRDASGASIALWVSYSPD